MHTLDEGVTLESYAAIMTAPDWPDADIYRAIVCNLPRRILHEMEIIAQPDNFI